jgi:phytoene synthase
MQQVQTWEQNLLALAYEAIHPQKLQLPQFNGDLSTLQQAYAHCESLTSHHSRSFYLASSLLSSEKQKAIRALYAFCRVTDDIVDNNPGANNEQLQQWQKRALSLNPSPLDPVALAWADTRTQYNVPILYAQQLVDGVARDLTQTRYETFADLATYSYGVASTVGLMSMHIVGFDGPEAIPYAIKLGLALQMTNILRDVAEDWQRGRVYLPQDELAAFGLTEDVIADGVVTEKWREFMRFQIERNHQLYEESWPGIQMLDQSGRLAIVAASGFYRAILHDIERHDYDVFSRRAHVGTWGKVKLIPKFWWQSR